MSHDVAIVCAVNSALDSTALCLRRAPGKCRGIWLGEGGRGLPLCPGGAAGGCDGSAGGSCRAGRGTGIVKCAGSGTICEYHRASQASPVQERLVLCLKARLSLRARTGPSHLLVTAIAGHLHACMQHHAVKQDPLGTWTSLNRLLWCAGWRGGKRHAGGHIAI